MAVSTHVGAAGQSSEASPLESRGRLMKCSGARIFARAALGDAADGGFWWSASEFSRLSSIMICWILVDAEGKISHLRRGQGGRLEQDLVAVSGHLRPMQPTREGQFENSVFSARAERISARKAREAALT